jgi:hypothetical protein
VLPYRRRVLGVIAKAKVFRTFSDKVIVVQSIVSRHRHLRVNKENKAMTIQRTTEILEKLRDQSYSALD